MPFFFRQLTDFPALDSRAKALQLMISSRVPLTVRGVARNAGVSPRQLERLSQICAGVSPKMLTRVARFERAIKLKAQHGWSWMKTAHESEYHDQMHMIRDFREFSGTTPGLVVNQITSDHLISLF